MGSIRAALLLATLIAGCDQQVPREQPVQPIPAVAPAVTKSVLPRPIVRQPVGIFDPIPKVLAGPRQDRCPDRVATAALQPLTTGPFRVGRIYCHSYGNGDDRQWLPDDVSTASDAPYVDGPVRNKAVQADEMGEYLAVSPLAGGRIFYVYLGTANRSFLGMDDEQGAILSWARGGREVRTVRQRTTRRFGFTLGPVEPIAVGMDRKIRKLSAPVDQAGPLDAVLWVGPGSLALGEFGTRGNQYEPGRKDLNPTLAVFDSRSGQVLDRLALRRFNNGRSNGAVYAFDGIDAVTMPDDRLAVLLWKDDSWVFWKQGEAAKIVAHPYRKSPNFPDVKFKLTPDGNAVVATLSVPVPRPKGPPLSVVLSRETVQIGGKRYPKFAVGVGVALHTPDTGKLVWARRIRVSMNNGATKAVIAPSGDIMAARLVVDSTPTIAIFRVADGALLQTLPSPQGPPMFCDFRMQFSDYGRQLTISQCTSTHTYRR